MVGLPEKDGMTTSSPFRGTAFRLQFAAVPHDPPAAFVHVSVVGTTRSSRHSSVSRRIVPRRDRLISRRVSAGNRRAFNFRNHRNLAMSEHLGKKKKLRPNPQLSGGFDAVSEGFPTYERIVYPASDFETAKIRPLSGIMMTRRK